MDDAFRRYDMPLENSLNKMVGKSFATFWCTPADVIYWFTSCTDLIVSSILGLFIEVEACYFSKDC